jgi:hypothetical protein
MSFFHENNWERQKGEGEGGQQTNNDRKQGIKKQKNTE